MNDYDKEGILEQYQTELDHYNKKVIEFNKIKMKEYGIEEHEYEEEEYEEEYDEENMKLMISFNKDLQKELEAIKLENKQQKEFIQKIQADENKWKETFEQNKQKEMDKLMETTKAKDREIFCLIARNMDLEKHMLK